MFDSPFDFLTLVIAIVALVVARKAFTRIDEMRERLSALEARASRLATASLPPPIPTQAETEQAPPLVAEQWEPVRPTEAPPLDLDATQAAVAPPPAPPPPLADRGFEELLGTQWVVWIGGLALALGGFFLVRYSIEAGLIGPGVRITLGGIFAAALLAARVDAA